jgi:hypothetical protein
MTTARTDKPENWTSEEREAWIRAYNAGDPVELPYAEHDEGECETCDALRALMREADAR